MEQDENSSKKKNIFNDIATKTQQGFKKIGEKSAEFGEKIKNEADNVKESIKEKRITEKIKVKGTELLDTLKQLIKEGNIRRIIVRNNSGKKVLDIPVGAGVATFILAPYMSLIASFILVVTNFTIEYEKRIE